MKVTITKEAANLTYEDAHRVVLSFFEQRGNFKWFTKVKIGESKAFVVSRPFRCIVVVEKLGEEIVEFIVYQRYDVDE